MSHTNMHISISNRHHIITYTSQHHVHMSKACRTKMAGSHHICSIITCVWPTDMLRVSCIVHVCLCACLRQLHAGSHMSVGSCTGVCVCVICMCSVSCQPMQTSRRIVVSAQLCRRRCISSHPLLRSALGNQLPSSSSVVSVSRPSLAAHIASRVTHLMSCLDVIASKHKQHSPSGRIQPMHVRKHTRPSPSRHAKATDTNTRHTQHQLPSPTTCCCVDTIPWQSGMGCIRTPSHIASMGNARHDVTSRVCHPSIMICVMLLTLCCILLSAFCHSHPSLLSPSPSLSLCPSTP